MGALPVSIISGYLGAGKTTLVNQMLRQANGVRIAVLVNEFGALPIDEDLIEARDDDLISIAGGCICCSFGSDLAAALTQLGSLAPSPEHIVIEASGVALPGSVASTIGLVDGLRVEGICVLADCVNIQKMARDEYIGDTIERQLDDADLIVLSKTDLVSWAEREAVESWLAQTWPGKRFVSAQNGRVPNEVLLGRFTTDGNWLASPHADDQYDSLVLQFDAPVDAARLAQQLTHPSLGVIRAKGYVTDVSGRIALLQLAGSRSEVSFPENPGASGLVCIGLKDRLGRDALQRLVPAPVSS